jgi:hypothetical protein
MARGLQHEVIGAGVVPASRFDAASGDALRRDGAGGPRECWTCRTPVATAPAPAYDRPRRALAAGERGDAVKVFLKAVGVSAIVIALMPLLPVWSKLLAECFGA